MMNEQETKEFVKELLSKVDNTITLEDNENINISGFDYYFEMVDEEDVEDEGKYQTGAEIYEVVVDNGTSECTKTGIFVMQSYTRWGDYWNGMNMNMMLHFK